MKNFSMWIIAVSLLIMGGCDIQTTTPAPTSTSGVQKATIKVKTDLNGKTTEQNNIIARYQEDNKPGSIKHLYVISAMSGQIILYSTVKGKVTSSGKRLSPMTVAVNSGEYNSHDGIDVEIDGKRYETSEVLQDDGTYGSSVEYVYWFDSKGVYHQQYITGGMILHVSSQPIAVKNIVFNLEK